MIEPAGEIPLAVRLGVAVSAVSVRLVKQGLVASHREAGIQALRDEAEAVWVAAASEVEDGVALVSEAEDEVELVAVVAGEMVAAEEQLAKLALRV